MKYLKVERTISSEHVDKLHEILGSIQPSVWTMAETERYAVTTFGGSTAEALIDMILNRVAR